MRRRFPELTSLGLWPAHKLQVFPDLFLGGSAARLQDLYLADIPFPGLPKLLLSATHLVTRHSPPFEYSPFRIHFTRWYGHCPLRLDQPRISFTWIRIPSVLSRPGKPTSSSLDMLCSPRSHISFVQGGQRIFGRPRGLHRCSSAQPPVYNLLQ